MTETEARIDCPSCHAPIVLRYVSAQEANVTDTLREILARTNSERDNYRRNYEAVRGRQDATQAAIDLVVGDLHALLDDCSQCGGDEESFVRVSAVRQVLRFVNLTTEQLDAANLPPSPGMSTPPHMGNGNWCGICQKRWPCDGAAT